MRTADALLTGLAWTVALAGCAARAAEPSPSQTPDRQAVLRYAAESGEGTWRKLAGPADNLSSRELFTCALALAEAKMHPDRLAALFDMAARMQDRDPTSRGYGNFRWSWSNPAVMDFNAVEFCMQGGALLWMRHRDAMPPAARQTLREVLDFAVEGCLRHKVRPSYTNIALMNAENLILLGEALERPQAADEGYARLDGVIMNIWENGIAEYGSPTYYGVDLDCLLLIEAFCGRERGRAQARALLELFWTDIAMNYFAPSQRLGGPHSRDYDYLRGHGPIDNHLWMAGWIGGPMRGGIGAVFPALGRWQPPKRLHEMSLARWPRLVRAAWGPAANASRTQCLLKDVTLGIAGANYGSMDLPLTADLPGTADFPRCYFIPDARHDPYGKVKIPEGRGPHSKTLHPKPFWAAAQRRTDALGLVLYRDEDMTKAAATLESHFVVPREVDGLWVGDRPVLLKAGAPLTVPLKDGDALVLRKGAGAVGVRVAWARGTGDAAAPAALVDDGNTHGVVRLTVTHLDSKEPPASVAGAGAALWVRIGDGLATDDAFDAWRRQFAAARAEAQVASGKVTVQVAGAAGPLSVAADYPVLKDAALDPPPSRAVLEVDGEDIGRRLLQDLEPVKSRQATLTNLPRVTLPAGKSVAFEAESGSVVPVMAAAADPDASGGKFVWMPGEAGAKGSGQGRILWTLDVPADARYYLWGRVLSPTPEDDSFFVGVSRQDAASPLLDIAWHLGTHAKWTWVPLVAEGSREPLALALPKGQVRLEIRVREDGAKIDRLFLTPQADEKPPAE